ncbi:MAG: UDP-N-acetylmuramoyl-tripeptide--D-alanyl-D-alanine ligase [Planctomycetota bacterium]|nr:UDP-N-acetylmuramoyl-tripeptide--D-alanyl-D-alanine ligase [Planctomycetota bacterium]
MNTAHVASAVGAILHGSGSTPLRRVVIDSRAVQPGDLFVALRGARTDGHLHLRQAQEKGAAAALVLPDGPERPAGLDYLVVPDTLAALGALARFHFGRLQARVIGITGSVGKTTAKDFLAHLLGGPQHKVFAAPASYNSEIGLPLAILAAPLDTRLLVLEYGVNAPGEMDVLIDIARPHQAWITAIAAAHLEGLGDLQAVATEKSKLGAAVREQSRVWMDRGCWEKVEEHAASWQADVVVLDPMVDADFKIIDATPGAMRCEHQRWGSLLLPLSARHQVATALVAARIAMEHGASVAEVRERMSSLQPPSGRLTISELEQVTVIDDAYNANPASMHAALELLGSWPTSGRRIAVLGTMKELGPAAEVLHRQVGCQVVENGIDLLISVGSGGPWIAASAHHHLETRVVDDSGAAAAILAGYLKPEDVLLLKASRSESLERVILGIQSSRSQQGAERSSNEGMEA